MHYTSYSTGHIHLKKKEKEEENKYSAKNNC
jgi:hypothetical protein